MQSVKSHTTDQDPEAQVPSSIDSNENANARKGAEVPSGNSQKRDRMPNGRKPSLQRNQSDIFKSFSKSRTALKKEDTDSSLAASSTTSAVVSVRITSPRRMETSTNGRTAWLKCSGGSYVCNEHF